METHDHERGAIAAHAGEAVAGDHLQAPEVGGALGGDATGDRLFERTVDHVGHHVADRGAGVDGGGICGADDGAGRGGDLHRGQGAGVVRDGGGDDAVDAEGGVGLGVVERAVDSVRGHARSAGIVNVDSVFADRYRGNEVERVLVAIDAHGVGPGAFRQFGDCRGHGAA
jgi:hypothetical protein